MSWRPGPHSSAYSLALLVSTGLLACSGSPPSTAESETGGGQSALSGGTGEEDTYHGDTETTNPEGSGSSGAVPKGTGGAGSSTSAPSAGGSGTASGGAQGMGAASTGGGGADLGPELTLVVEEGAGLCSIDGVIETANSGYLGEGYGNSNNETGAEVSWSIHTLGSTNVDLSFRHAHSGSEARPAELFVNGTQVATLEFPSTGDFSVWSDFASASVPLHAGDNTITLRASGPSGLSNVDSLTVSGRGISAGTCPPVIPDPHSDLLAFPGAEGFGRLTSGGRGGEVYHVTNLDDSGPGSFRDAVSQANRIVVFDVGGVIRISDRIVVKKNIYVAGQTAPGGGITIYENGLAFNGDSGNNIIRYIRIRMGKNGDSGKDAVAISENQNYIFDHVSISWGRDGTLDVNGSGVDNLTFQDTIVGQGINNSNHSTGGLMQSGKWSVIRSLYIDNKTRNPKARGTHEFINSVVYNWGTNGYIMGDTEGLSECNLVGNYFIYGPSSDGDTHITGTTPSFHVYAQDNWVDSNRNGTLDGTLLSNYKTATVETTPFAHPSGVDGKLSAQAALNHVVESVGASLVRDAVDELLITQLRSFGSQGQIINTEDDNLISGNVGDVPSGEAPLDTDRDGMPDAWETMRGLDPNQADDSDDDDDDGYTNIEEYLSCLVGEGDC